MNHEQKTQNICDTKYKVYLCILILCITSQMGTPKENAESNKQVNKHDG